MLQTSSKWDKDKRHRCCKSVDSFSALVKLLQTQMFKRNHLTTKHPSVYPRLGQFFPSWEFLFQACQKSPRAVWPLPDCNANRQSPLEFVSLDVIGGNSRMPAFLCVYIVPQKQFRWDKAAVCKFTPPISSDTEPERKTLVIYCFSSPSKAQSRWKHASTDFRQYLMFPSIKQSIEELHCRITRHTFPVHLKVIKQTSPNGFNHFREQTFFSNCPGTSLLNDKTSIIN